VNPQHTPWYDWSSVNWQHTDAMIARHLGCSRTRVGQMRRSLDRPPSEIRGRREHILNVLGMRPETRQRREREIARRIVETEATVESEATALGISAGLVYQILCRHSARDERRAALARKMSESQRQNPRGRNLVIQARKARVDEAAAEQSPIRLVAVRECSACGARVSRDGTRCRKCGSSAIERDTRSAPLPTPPQAKPVTGRERVKAFIDSLEGSAA
jgi:ribosomal protein L40E